MSWGDEILTTLFVVYFLIIAPIYAPEVHKSLDGVLGVALVVIFCTAGVLLLVGIAQRIGRWFAGRGNPRNLA